MGGVWGRWESACGVVRMLVMWVSWWVGVGNEGMCGRG